MRQAPLPYDEIADEFIVPMSHEERLYLNRLLDEPKGEYRLLAEALWQEGCKFPRQQAALLLRNAPGDARRLIAMYRPRPEKPQDPECEE